MKEHNKNYCPLYNPSNEQYSTADISIAFIFLCFSFGDLEHHKERLSSQRYASSYKLAFDQNKFPSLEQFIGPDKKLRGKK